MATELKPPMVRGIVDFNSAFPKTWAPTMRTASTATMQSHYVIDSEVYAVEAAKHAVNDSLPCVYYGTDEHIEGLAYFPADPCVFGALGKQGEIVKHPARLTEFTQVQKEHLTRNGMGKYYPPITDPWTREIREKHLFSLGIGMYLAYQRPGKYNHCWSLLDTTLPCWKIPAEYLLCEVPTVDPGWPENVQSPGLGHLVFHGIPALIRRVISNWKIPTL